MPRQNTAAWATHRSRSRCSRAATGRGSRRVVQPAAARPELEEDDDQRLGGQVGLHAVPGDGDQAADDGGDVRAEHAEDRPVDHRVRHARDLARLGHQVAEHVDDDDADDQRDQHLPARQAEREQAARGDVAADAVHVGHPEGEDVVRRPGLLLQRRQVLVGEPGVVAGLDVAGPGTVLVGLDLGLRVGAPMACSFLISVMVVPRSRPGAQDETTIRRGSSDFADGTARAPTFGVGRSAPHGACAPSDRRTFVTVPMLRVVAADLDHRGELLGQLAAPQTVLVVHVDLATHGW